MPRVSIILPTFNRAKVLSRSVMSILDQTYQDFELLIIDDGSTDETADAIQQFSDERIRYFKSDRNRGRGSARNIGLQMAAGEFIAFQDSDDESLPTRIEREVAVLDASDDNVGIVYSDMYRISKDGKKFVFKSPHFTPKDGILYPESLAFTLINIGINAATIKRDAIRRTGFFDETLPFFVDLEYFIRLSKNSLFAHLPEPLINYYEVDSDFAKLSKIAESREKILSKYYVDVSNNKKLYSLHLFAIGNDFCYSGNTLEGRQYLGKSLTVKPLHFLRMLSFIASFMGPKIYRYLVDLKNRLFS
jgi:glycosyltransferase involved in cell wall biosynthesis